MKITKQVYIRSKTYCILWLIVHGFIPKNYFWYKQFNFFYTSHHYFDYDKFELCGKYYPGSNYKDKETWEINGVWDFPKGVLKIL